MSLLPCGACLPSFRLQAKNAKERSEKSTVDDLASLSTGGQLNVYNPTTVRPPRCRVVLPATAPLTAVLAADLHWTQRSTAPCTACATFVVVQCGTTWRAPDCVLGVAFSDWWSSGVCLSFSTMLRCHGQPKRYSTCLSIVLSNVQVAGTCTTHTTVYAASVPFYPRRSQCSAR